MRAKKRFFTIIALGLFVFLITLMSGNDGLLNNRVMAQSLRPETVAPQAYQILEDFPLANQYISQETGVVDPNNTLLMRLIRYHQYVKRRPVQYRFDWKLTLADYLDANEAMLEAQYPGQTVLTENPFSGDRQVIQALTRQQREELITVLTNIYNPPANNSNSNNAPTNNNQNLPNRPNLPSSGAADLLRF
jgi:hypothetical protein